MELTLKYFGQVAERTGTTEENLRVDAPMNLEELTRHLSEKHGLNDLPFRLAVNRQFEEADHVLSDRDEIALLPPFAGG